MNIPAKVNVNFLILALLIIALYFIYSINRGSGPGVLKVVSGDSSISLEMTGKTVDLIDIINGIMQDEHYNADARLLLKKFDLYDVKNVEFVDYLRRLSPDDELSQEILALLFDGAGPFDHQFHTYRNIHSLTAALEIIGSDYDSEAANRLRYAADHEEGIFKLKPIPVRVTASKAVKIENNKARVCKDSGFEGHVLLLVAHSGEPQHVTVSGFLDICPGLVQDDDGNNLSFVQVNLHTAEKLFGSADHSEHKPAKVFKMRLGYRPAAHSPPFANVAANDTFIHLEVSR